MIQGTFSTTVNGSSSTDRTAGGDVPLPKFDPVVLKKNRRIEVAQEVLKGRTVLLIEDSWLIAQGYKSMLELAGMVVIGPAASVLDAEELLVAKAPDFALVDINLEDGGDSYGLIDAMVARKIPVVIISGDTISPRVASLVDCVLNKPVGGSMLMATLRRVGAVHKYC